MLIWVKLLQIFYLKGDFTLTNFKSLNSSKSNMQSVKDHDKNAAISMQEQLQEKKQYEFNKFNVNGENQRGDDLERSKNQ
jgi:hypothetical protein